MGGPSRDRTFGPRVGEAKIRAQHAREQAEKHCASVTLRSVILLYRRQMPCFVGTAQFLGGEAIMKKLLATVLLLTTIAPAISYAGPCDNASDRASDGSRCGSRAASERPGGR